MSATTPTITKPLTKAQASLLARLRDGWTLTCYQALYLKRSPAWYVSRANNRESCFASPAQALYLKRSSAGSLKATQDHLEDMRKIAFDLLKRLTT